MRETVRTQASGGLTEAALTDCVATAMAAPSIHNSQPWRFRIRAGGIDVFADQRRRLEVIDPAGRELLVSVGAAVFNLRLAMRRQARVPTLRWFPNPAEPDLVAHVAPGQSTPPDSTVNALAAAIPRRHTNRRPFTRVVIPTSIREELVAAARIEGATLRIADAVSRGAILSLARTADERLRAEGVYHAELAEWTLPAHDRHDGVPPQAFGPLDTLDTLPVRDFGLAQPHLTRRSERYEPYPMLAVIATDRDDVHDWLRAGQALQHVLLVATVYGLVATPMSQPLEVPALRKLITDTATRWAQVILRLGYAQPTTSTPRRSLADVLVTMRP